MSNFFLFLGAFEKAPGQPHAHTSVIAVRETQRDKLVGLELFWHLLGTSQNSSVGAQVRTYSDTAHTSLIAAHTQTQHIPL